MKTLIFFTFAFILCFFKANSAPDPVLTYYGKSVRTGVECYPVMRLLNKVGYDSIGFIFPAALSNKTCPVGVAFASQIEGADHSITITPVNPKKGVIRLSTDVNIKFSDTNICHESNVWRLKYDKAMKQYVVMMGGVEGNPGPETLDNWFKFEKAADGYYKLVFCPSVCSYCKTMCGDIGTAIDNNGVSRLVLGGEPLSFGF
ncbi:hypothetical protein M8C21_001348 [Ambrosia artemisiifolia]|uniref:Miraculin n=1 Tax=Ambrosia artemisiifolia TaxID=4212 RepID=A0AAD5BXP0_AMBAR|nr:hypothetical protein M8C21_001348 [Ambrosia artemisiifolia]